MPIDNNQQTVYINSGDPDAHDTKDIALGQLGTRYITVIPLRDAQSNPISPSGASRSMQIVLVDSTLTSQVTRADVMLWRNKAKYEVTPKVVNALNRNEVAGVMPGTATAGNYTSIQWRGPQFVKVTAADQAAVASGDKLIPSAADDGKANRVAMGTAPTHTVIGTATGPVVNGMALCDLSCPETT